MGTQQLIIIYDKGSKNYSLLPVLLSQHMCLAVFIGMILFFYNSNTANAQKTYHVSPDGIGLASIQEAKNNIRNHTSVMSGDIIVELSDGRYFIDEPLTFDHQDGGSDEYSVIFKAASGARPVISGGIQVSNWSQSPENEKIYCTSLINIDYVRNIYVNGKRAKRAADKTSRTASLVYEENGKKTGYVFPKSQIQNFDNASNVEISYLRNWRHFYFLVQSIEDGATLPDVDDDKYLVRIKNLNWYYTMGYNQLSPGNSLGSMTSFYFENAYELLDEPGEFYFDKTAQLLFYYPREGEDMNNVDVVVPRLEHLIKTKTASVEQKVRNLTFEGIEFAHTTWEWPSVNGFGVNQGSAIIADNGSKAGDKPELNKLKIKMPGAIWIEDVENLTFKSNVFTHIGTTAIDVRNNADSVNIISNTFCDLSASAISLASWFNRLIDQPEEGLVQNILIKNNYIEKIGVEFASSAGIEAIYTRNVLIDHNELYDMPYSGITAGWGWHISLSTLANVVVSNNKVTGVIQRCHDGGGFYSLSAFDEDGLTIEGNVFDEITLPPTSHNEGVIYTDQQSSNVWIKNNVVKSPRLWFFHNWGGVINVDSMYVSSSTTSWNGNIGDYTDITLNENDIWRIPHKKADEIEANAGIEDGMAPPQSIDNNVAINKLVQASSYLDSKSIAQKANDNTINSVWQSDEENQAWWSVDLNADFIVSSIELVLGREGEDFLKARKNFVIEASSDLNFDTDKTDTVYSQGEESHENDMLMLMLSSENPYRYFRIKQTATGENLQIAEFRVFGVEYHTPVVESINLALNKTSYASSVYEGHSVAWGNDGNIKSAWASSGINDKINYPRWWVDLKDACLISSVVFVARQDVDSYDANRSGFVIEGSNASYFPEDKTEILYTQPVDEIIPNKGTKEIEIKTDKAYRYIRIRKTTQAHLIFGDLKVFGTVVESGTELGTGMGEKDFWREIALYPNPVRDMLNVELPGNCEDVSLRVISLLGSVVIEKKYNLKECKGHICMNASLLESNLYFLQIQGEKLKVTYKFIKI